MKPIYERLEATASTEIYNPAFEQLNTNRFADMNN